MRAGEMFLVGLAVLLAVIAAMALAVSEPIPQPAATQQACPAGMVQATAVRFPEGTVRCVRK